MWQNSGICSVGDGCKFAHEAIEETTDFETTFAARMAAQSSTEDVLMESAAGTPTELPSLVMKKKKLLRPRLKAHRLSHDDGPKQCLTHGYISDGSQDSGVGVIKETTDFDEDGIPDQGSPPGSMSSEKGETKKAAAHP